MHKAGFNKYIKKDSWAEVQELTPEQKVKLKEMLAKLRAEAYPSNRRK